MYQKIIFVGYLGNDPEMRFFPSGEAVTNFSIASTRRYTDVNGERAEVTTWARVSITGNQAEAVNQYLKKGSRALVEGVLNPDPTTGGPKIWTRGDGSPGASFDIRAFRVVFMDDKSGDAGSRGNYQSGPDNIENNTDDIPF